MIKPLNFIYCFDDNYIKQAFTSIISLLDSVSEPINIYILKKASSSKLDLADKILDHKKLNNLKVFEISLNEYNFPNLLDVHVTEATYYRIFISQYLPSEVEFVTYLDADTVCINNPISEIKDTIAMLKESKYSIGARTEIEKNLKNNEVLERLNLIGPYFNAGVLFLNLKMWRKNNYQEKLLDTMEKHSNKILHWDQDVMNKFFNGNYLQIRNNLNFNSENFDIKKNKDSVLFVHYIGSKKPWSVLGYVNDAFEIYHDNYRKINQYNKYHITHTWKRASFKLFIKLFLNFNILKFKYPIGYIKNFIKSLKQ